MARGGYRVGAGRPKGAKSPRQRIPREDRADAVKTTAERLNLTPLEYMLGVMNDPEADVGRRDRMAVAAAPFEHPRAAEAQPGKKEQAEDAAKEAAAGRFAPPPPPSLRAH